MRYREFNSFIAMLLVLTIYQMHGPEISAQSASANGNGVTANQETNIAVDTHPGQGFSDAGVINFGASHGFPTIGPQAKTSATGSVSGDPDDVYWDNSISPSFPGTNATVLALLPFQDGLVAGGDFTTAGGTSANHIAFFDGTSWSPLGTGLDGTVHCLGIYDGMLVAGGSFTMSGTVPVNSIAAWNGESWEPLGSGIDGNVRALTVFGGKLVAGGFFTSAGETSANNIAAWDGSTWTSLIGGVNGGVRSLAVFENSLITGGESLRKWDGVAWSWIEPPFQVLEVNSLAIYGSKLVVAGWLAQISGGIEVANIACWDGESWAALGSGSASKIYAMINHNDNLIIGGACIGCMSWNGSAWTTVGYQNCKTVYALAVYDANLVQGIYYYEQSGHSGSSISVWNGSDWNPLGTGLNGAISCLAVYQGNLIAAGSFAYAGGKLAHGIAAWDGLSWEPLGSGLNDLAICMTVFNGKLIVGGWFTSAGGVPVSKIASWDGTSWSSLGEGFPDSGSVASTILALSVFDDKLIAAGRFLKAGHLPASSIAAWDGTSWQALGTGMRTGSSAATINALTIFGDNLVAGGHFTQAGDISAANIASWDGESWSEVGGGVSGEVMAAAEFKHRLVVGGLFLSAGGVSANNIAVWDRTTWTPIQSGIQGGYVGVLHPYQNSLIVGGTFTTAGGQPASRIAAWNGSTWFRMGSGITAGEGGYFDLQALATYDMDLVVGGDFVSAGFKAAAFLAQWSNPTLDVHEPTMTESHPSEFRLSQNYPNPFNLATSIDFNLTSTSNVSIEIFNILGQKVRTLVNQQLSTGRYRVQWDSSDEFNYAVPSGVYLYRLQVGQTVETKKMVLLK